MKEIHIPKISDYHITLSPRSALAVVLVAVILAASPAKASIITLPGDQVPSWDGYPLSVYAMWNFADEPWGYNIPAKHGSFDGDEDEHNLYINPPAVSWPPILQCGLNTVWSDGKIYNYGHLDAGFVINLPNWIDKKPEKELWLQIWYGDADATEPFDIEVHGVKMGHNWSLPYSAKEEYGGYDYDEISGTGKYFGDWRFSPNPDYDIITLHIPPNAYIDQITIYTISVPEPTTLTLLALGALPLLKRRKYDYTR